MKLSIEVDLVKDADPNNFADKLQEFLFAAFENEDDWPEVDVFYGADLLSLS